MKIEIKNDNEIKLGSVIQYQDEEYGKPLLVIENKGRFNLLNLHSNQLVLSNWFDDVNSLLAYLDEWGKPTLLNAKIVIGGNQ